MGKRWGVVKETAAPNKTMCDYDGTLPADLRGRVRAVRRILHIRPQRIRLDRTARGFHLVILWSHSLKPVEIVAIQAILGSDPMRELLNLGRVRSRALGKLNRKYWNILYDFKLEIES